MADQLDLFRGGGNSLIGATELRDQLTDQVLSNAGDDWRDKAIDCIRRHWTGKEGIAEDFRLTCAEYGIYPHHSNAWGAITLTMKRRELLIETGEWRSPRSVKSHARPTKVYRVR